tara:strand:+ start:20617 stop:20901 length:285 start_codon:yes stop_codon:yes gene_type:complete
MIEKIENLSLEGMAQIAQVCINIMQDCKRVYDETHPCSGEGSARHLYVEVQDNADAILTEVNKMLDLQFRVSLCEDPYTVKKAVKAHKEAYAST